VLDAWRSAALVWWRLGLVGVVSASVVNPGQAHGNEQRVQATSGRAADLTVLLHSTVQRLLSFSRPPVLLRPNEPAPMSWNLLERFIESDHFNTDPSLAVAYLA